MNKATTIAQLTEQPSKTLNEAIDRLSATALARIDEVVKERDDARWQAQEFSLQCERARAQRDELAACLREFREGFASGWLVTHINSSKAAYELACLLQQADAAILRLEVRDRLDGNRPKQNAIDD